MGTANIRAHHLLCMKYFKGKGYNKEFVLNFSKIIDELDDDSKIRVTHASDVICSSCPHNSNSKCVKRPTSDIDVRKKDNSAMRILGIKMNQELRVADAEKLVNSRLSELKVICEDCEWQKYCN